MVIRGELSPRFGYAFEGMALERTSGSTVLTGDVRDSAHLHELIERIEELNLELVSIRPISGEGATEFT